MASNTQAKQKKISFTSTFYQMDTFWRHIVGEQKKDFVRFICKSVDNNRTEFMI